ncbi:MAG: TlpA family protein disulfide reductase [Actinomycetota bacterium]
MTDCSRRRRLAPVLAFALLAPACASGAGSSPQTIRPTVMEELVAKVASYDLAVGPQRFMVGVLTQDQVQVGWGTVELAFAYLGTADEQLSGDVVFEATASYLPIPPELGRPAAQPKDGPTLVTGAEGRGVYAGQAEFDRAGFWGVVVKAEVDGRPLSAQVPFEVRGKHLYPWVGEDAPRTENLTIASTDAPRAAIDSRAGTSGQDPDPLLHSKTVAQSIVSGKPTLLVVSTPVYCVSRFCGPVTDVIQDLGNSYGEAANFIHIEIWRDFQNQVINKGAAEWVLREKNVLEPWVFLIDKDGKIAARWDNVATRQEIEPLLQRQLGA